MTSNGKSATALRTIGEVAEELDVATHVLRFWESKFYQIKPQKRRGRRYYRVEDVNTITKIKELLYEQGYTIRGVQKYLAAEVKNKNTESPVDVKEQVEPKPQAPLNPVLFAPQQAAKQPVSAFKTDMFGNIIPANGGVSPVTSPSPSVVQKSYSKQDVEKLKNVYSGLREARERLKNVA